MLSLLPHRAALTPHRLALVFGDRRWSFAELAAWAARWETFLTTQGVKPGDRVAVLAHNQPAYVAIIHALPQLGAILVPLNWRLTPTELVWQLAHVEAQWLLVDEPLGNFLPILPGTRVLGLSEVQSPQSKAQNLQSPVSNLQSPHSLIFTSGTTGQPKAVALTFENHWWSAIGSALNLGLREDDRWLACLPLFHVGGLAIVMKGVIYGMSVILQPGFDPEAVNRAIVAERATHISVVSVMLQRLLAAWGEAPYPDHLRCVLLGGGPAPHPLLEDCARRGLPAIQTYGLTEAASQVTTLPPAEALRKLGSAGKPLFGTEVRIAPLEEPSPKPSSPRRGWREAPGEGGIGEIIIRGPTLTPGYWRNPEATARAWRDGWWHTGDVGRLDDEGYLYVLDRRDDLIISGGENIYPAEVEAALLAHPAIEEAAVIGQDDAQWGQVPVAFICLRPGQDVRAAELCAFCADRLAKYKIPVQWHGVEALPRNASGKLLRHELKRLALKNRDIIHPLP